MPRFVRPACSWVVLLVGCGGGGSSVGDTGGNTAGSGGGGAAPIAGSAGSAALSGAAGSGGTAATSGTAGTAGGTTPGGTAATSGGTAATSGGTAGQTDVDEKGGAADRAGAAGMGGTAGGAGGIKIFDGATLNGWTSTPTGMFSVMGGALVATGKGRGALATNTKYTHFRLLFSVHPGGTGGHAPTVLLFGNYPDSDALGAIQFQPPKNGHWDYRPGKNNEGGTLFTRIGAPGPAVDGWTSCEIVANATTGEAKMACGGLDVLHFKDPTAGQGKAAPFAIQTHNAGITDSYKDLSIEDNIQNDDYVSVK